MLNKKVYKNAGFTLIETIVVIAGLSVLASITLSNFGGLINKSTEAVDEANLRILNVVTDAYRAQNPSDELFECGDKTDLNRMEALISKEYIDKSIQAKKAGATFKWELPTLGKHNGRWVYNR